MEPPTEAPAGRPGPGDAAVGSDGMEASPPDRGRAALARELYWAEEAVRVRRTTAAEAREALRDFTALMRDEERQVLPRAEPNLASPSAWRRQLKLRLFRLLRPVTRRYDRLIGDLAELTAVLAARLVETEAEVERLRTRLGAEEGGEGAARRAAEPGGGD